MLEPKILVQNIYLFSILSIFLVMYGPRLQPRLPPSLRNLFNSNIFRGVILFLISYMSTTNIKASIVISIIFMVTINILHTNDVLDTFENEGFVIHGQPLESCNLYNKESINLTGTAFYPINKINNDDDSNNNDELNY